MSRGILQAADLEALRRMAVEVFNICRDSCNLSQVQLLDAIEKMQRQ